MNCNDFLTFLKLLFVICFNINVFNCFHLKATDYWFLDNLQTELFASEICQTDACWAYAKDLKSSLNLSVNPCDDFYEFVCGGWIQKEKLPPTEAKWEPFVALQKKVSQEVIQLLKKPVFKNEHKLIDTAQQFFSACTNTDELEEAGTEPLLQILNSFGGWPIISKYWFDEEFCWQNQISDLNRLFGLNVLFSVTVNQDLKNDSLNCLVIEPAETVFPSYILENPNYYTKQIVLYGQWILQSAEEILKCSLFIDSTINTNFLKIDAFEIVQFEIKFAELLAKSRADSFENLYNLFTIKQLQKLTENFGTKNKINWLHMISNIFQETDVRITADRTVIVPDVNILKEILKLIDKTPKRVIANYIGWRIVQFFNKDTTFKMRQLSFDIDKLVLGFKHGVPREEECKEKTEYFFSDVVSYLYLKKHFDQTKKHKVLVMSKFIQETIKNRLKNSDWIDVLTKSEAIEKVNNMKLIIGYTNASISLQRDIYFNLAIGPKHFKNVLFLNKYSVQNKLKQLDEIVSKEFFINPTVVNAFNYRNIIYILAGILNNPFFENERTDALNFGSLGFLIAHEMVHSFDNNGRQFNKDGNLIQWWQNETLEEFNLRMQCFIKEYSNYNWEGVDSINNMVNGEQTVGENIADTVGLDLAFEAYNAFSKNVAMKRLPDVMKTFTPEQLFFMSFAKNFCEIISDEAKKSVLMSDPHTPNKFRVIGAVSNSKIFPEVFNCPRNSPMNPNQKCFLI